MKLNKLFRRAVEIGITADPRGKERINKKLKKTKEKMSKAKGAEKRYFDEERTWNPFPDSRILWGTGNEEVKKLMVGVDIETAELLLADQLKRGGKKIDAIMAHHPEGRALADLDKILEVQIDIFAEVGVPVNWSEAALRPRAERIWRSIHADNLLRVEQAAELLKIPVFNCHTITDNLVWRFIEKKIVKKKFDELDEIINALNKIEEFDYYAKKGSPAILVNGSKSNRPGKIVATEFSGGTNGPEEFIEKQAQAGVGTILAMHFTEKEVELGKKHHVNMIQTNHIASDALGMNLLLDKLAKEESSLGNTLDVSGFVRVKRKA